MYRWLLSSVSSLWNTPTPTTCQVSFFPQITKFWCDDLKSILNWHPVPPARGLYADWAYLRMAILFPCGIRMEDFIPLTKHRRSTFLLQASRSAFGEWKWCVHGFHPSVPHLRHCGYRKHCPVCRKYDCDFTTLWTGTLLVKHREVQG